MNTIVKNPVLPGFHPDPCILRVKDTYYIANSTFEYYPGVEISASKDLVNWRVVSRPVTADKINLSGVPQGGGVWAPCLSHDGKMFYLIYSLVTNWSDDPYKDVDNFLITAESIDGEWSDPVYINSDGFDASLFHDDDGKKYYMGVIWDYRKEGTKTFSGILMQEFDAKTNKLVGEPKNVFKGTDRGLVEGPHIYKKDGYYYLFTAEGGTSVEHAQTVARSKSIFGPYELHPFKHFITSYKTDNSLQKAGHGSITDDGNGNWYYAHLCGRKLFNGNCVLGRETAIQNMIWKDGWPFLANGTNAPSDTFTVPYNVVKEKADKNIPFNDYTLKNVFQSLRKPMDGKYEVLSQREIEIVGGKSIRNRDDQSLFAVRQTDVSFRAEVTVKHNPEKFTHIAGLIYRYNEENQFLIYTSFDAEKGKKYVGFQRYMRNKIILDERFDYVDDEEIRFFVETACETARFGYLNAGKEVVFADNVDISCLSDEAACPMGFTGACIGIYAGDLSSRKKTAIFADFVYEGK